MSTANVAVQGIIGYQFNDPSFLTEALQAPGSPVRYAGTRAITDGNKRLALLGDTVIKLALLNHWYEGGHPRVTGSSLVASQANNVNLGIIGGQHRLRAYVNGNPAQQGVVTDSTLAATVEAIFGAVYLDCDKDLNPVKAVMRILGLGPV